MLYEAAISLLKPEAKRLGFGDNQLGGPDEQVCIEGAIDLRVLTDYICAIISSQGLPEPDALLHTQEGRATGFSLDLNGGLIHPWCITYFLLINHTISGQKLENKFKQ